MTQQRDIERLLDQWLSDGPDQAPDRVVDIVADRIERQSQRPAWRLQRRPYSMNAYAKFVVAAAAVLVVAVVGYNLLPGRSAGVGGPASSPSPTSFPASSPSASPAAAAGVPVDIPDVDTELTPGLYRWHPFTSKPTLSVVADIPDGWRGVGRLGMTVTGRGTEAPTGLGIAFIQADGLRGDPCHWDLKGTQDYGQPGDVTVGPTVDDLVAALRSNTSYTSSTPQPVTIDGFEGQELEIQLPPGTDLQPTTCDVETDSPDGHYFVFSGLDGGLYAQGPGNRWDMSIVDVGGTRLIIVALSYEGTPQADLDAAQAIVESIQLTP
jgi:hypothetical protein